jgi:hypothetical protein
MLAGQEAGGPEAARDGLLLLRLDGMATRTTNVGRFSFIEPSPYDAQEPSDGRPVISLPVWRQQIAGSWLIASVCIDFIQQMSSATLDRLGRSSVIVIRTRRRG